MCESVFPRTTCSRCQSTEITRRSRSNRSIGYRTYGFNVLICQISSASAFSWADNWNKFTFSQNDRNMPSWLLVSIFTQTKSAGEIRASCHDFKLPFFLSFKRGTEYNELLYKDMNLMFVSIFHRLEFFIRLSVSLVIEEIISIVRWDSILSCRRNHLRSNIINRFLH